MKKSLLILALLTLAMSLLGLPAHAGSGEAPGPATGGLAGAWHYVREVDTKADGSPAPVQALSDSDGLLLYTADGFMSVNIMPKGRTWSDDSATLAELRETVGNGTAYAGRYEVDASAHTVTHIPAVSLGPEFQGRRLVRAYSLDGDTLTLSGTFPYAGETIHFAITWVRDGAGRPQE